LERKKRKILKRFIHEFQPSVLVQHRTLIFAKFYLIYKQNTIKLKYLINKRTKKTEVKEMEEVRRRKRDKKRKREF
jgi:hypothetical protein